ncbi:MAG: MarR family transcriptional regulator [Sphingobacteriales bacterium]|nr:MAG: MarR family transcriptional regulator [Sphingobacteriales bacterium]
MKAAESRYSGCLYFASNALARKMERLAIKAWEPVGLPPSHAYLLLYVIDNPGTQPSVITEQLMLAPSTITRLMDRLEKEKLIIRQTEGKMIHAYPTAKAKGLVPKMESCIKSFHMSYAQELGHEPSMELVKNIVSVHDRLNE